MGLISNYVDGRIGKYLNARAIDFHHGLPVILDKDYIEDCYRIFYEAEDTSQLAYFFRTRYPHFQYIPTNNFYRVADSRMPLLHYPLATLITKTMTNLLFSDDPDISADSDADTDRLNSILDDNDFPQLLNKACEYESYSGAVGFKPVLDPSVSEHVILQAYPKESMDVIEKYGRPTEIIFKDYYEKDGSKYILYTICGIGYIDYRLKSDRSGNETDVPLTDLEETSDLRRIDIFNPDGTKYDKITAVYKENKTGAKSDYANILDDFCALDEVYSCLINFIRRSKIKTYLPENALKQDIRTGDKIIPNDYDTDNIILYDSNPEGTDQKIQRDIVDINNSVQGYITSFNNILLNALMTTGLSPASVGLDISGANASAEAINIRERSSLRTRSEKLKRWDKALRDLGMLCLNFDGMKGSNGKAYANGYDGGIHVQFAEYESPSFDQQVNSLGNALDHQLIDLNTALTMLYPKKTPDEIQAMQDAIEKQFPDADDIVDSELDGADDGDSEKDSDEDATND